MPAKRLSMRKIKEVLRLKASGLSNRKIAEAVSISRPTVADYIRRARAAGVRWPLPSDDNDSELEGLLFPEKPSISRKSRPVPDWENIHKELQSRGVTLELLWQEYKEIHPEGFQYSWFCQHYKRWSRKIDLVMRQEHRAGEKLFVDYAGQSVEVVDSTTGQVTNVQIFGSIRISQ